MSSRPSSSSAAARRSDVSEYRNRRMFASIQSTLGANSGAPTPSRVPNRRGRNDRRDEDIVAEKLKSVDDIIAQIADLSIRGERSAAQIKRNIEANPSTLDEMWDEDWAKLVASLSNAALNSDEAPFVVDILPTLMKYEDFVNEFCDEMERMATRLVLPIEDEEEGKDYKDLPSFLGAVICAQWPRGMHRDTQDCNPILYTALSIVRGWVLAVEGEREGKTFKTVKEIREEKLTEEDEEHEEQAKGSAEGEEAEEGVHDAVLLNRCAKALCDLCHSHQRSLWMRQPTLVDDMYKAFKPAITHNNALTPCSLAWPSGSVECATRYTGVFVPQHPSDEGRRGR